MEDILSNVVVILKYLSDNGGKDVVRKGLNDTYGGIKALFKRESQQEKLKALEAKPEDKAAQVAVENTIKDAVTDNELKAVDLKAQLDKAVATIQKEDENWFTQHNTIIKTDMQTISGDGNISIHDVSGSNITNNQKSQNHNGTGDTIAGDKIEKKYDINRIDNAKFE